jgi:hypothetical protein
MNLYETTAYRHQGTSPWLLTTLHLRTHAENMGDVLDAMSSGIAKSIARESKPEPQLLIPEVPAEPARQLLTEIMLADR